MARTEIAALEQLLSLVRRVLPEADLRWLIDEAKFNLPRELDFVHEAANSRRAAEQLAVREAVVTEAACSPFASGCQRC